MSARPPPADFVSKLIKGLHDCGVEGPQLLVALQRGRRWAMYGCLDPADLAAQVWWDEVWSIIEGAISVAVYYDVQIMFATALTLRQCRDNQTRRDR